MNLFNLVESMNLNGLIFLFIILIIIYAFRFIIAIMGISYGMTIMDTPNNIALKNIKIREYLVIIMCIIWALLKSLILKNFIPFIIIVPLILYLFINPKNRKTKGIVFIILNVTLLII